LPPPRFRPPYARNHCYAAAHSFGYRVAHYYFPHSGMIIAFALNSATGNDDIGDLAGSVYQTLQNAGAVHRLTMASQLLIPAGPRNPAGIRGPVHPGPDSSWPSSITATGKGRRNGNGLA
jgi:hypothetical protein